MRRLFQATCILVLLLAPGAGSAAKYHDYSSGTQSLNWTLEGRLVVTVHGSSQTRLSTLWVYFLHPLLDIQDEWSGFCSVNGVQFNYDPIAGSSTDDEGQWELVGFDLSSTSFAFPQTYTLTYSSTGTRGQYLDGVADDYQPEVGADYTTYTDGIPEIQMLSQFAASARDNPIANMVTGYVGVEQRGVAKIRQDIGGNCNTMTPALISYMRSLIIPTCYVNGVMITTSITIPVGSGTLKRNFDNHNGTVGHVIAGIWCDPEGTWLPSDPANATTSGMEHLQFLPIGYFPGGHPNSPTCGHPKLPHLKLN